MITAMRMRARARQRVRLLSADSTAREVTVTPRGPIAAVGAAAGRIVAWFGFSSGPTGEVHTDRARGIVVLAGCVLAVASPILALGVTVVGWNLPRLIAARRRDDDRRAVADEVLVAVELAAVAVHSGTNVPQTIDVIVPFLHGRLGAALRDAMEAARAGAVLDAELARLADEFGDEAGPLVTILRAALVDGDPVLPSLTRLCDRLHAERRRRVETDVRRLSVRLLIPLVTCSLPGFALVAVVPMALAALGHLGH